ncbi:hypothetical protein SVAN01_11769 [Stagonosporopsis vannaccii]|nr:hypothetical protein SVAN01_11769 [Stagonosporopsis vannaccii]
MKRDTLRNRGLLARKSRIKVTSIRDLPVRTQDEEGKPF